MSAYESVSTPETGQFDLAKDDHDHDACVEDAVARAEEICARNRVRLTDLRRQVLELLWKSHKPRGAYDILNDLAGHGRKAAPLTVYRALDFLVANGLAHRVESLNAFIGCIRPERTHAIHFLVCTHCGGATEMEDTRVTQAIIDSAAELDFAVSHPVVEIQGVCHRCRQDDPTT